VSSTAAKGWSERCEQAGEPQRRSLAVWLTGRIVQGRPGNMSLRLERLRYGGAGVVRIATALPLAASSYELAATMTSRPRRLRPLVSRHVVYERGLPPQCSAPCESWRSCGGRPVGPPFCWTSGGHRGHLFKTARVFEERGAPDGRFHNA